MSGSLKYSSSGANHQETPSGSQAPSAPVAKWSTPSSFGPMAASSQLRATRSRNIDIPNSKPRPRPKNNVSSLSRVPSSTRNASSRKASNSGTISSVAAPGVSSTLSWHTRPPRGGLNSQSGLHATTQEEASSKKGKKATASTRRREEFAFESHGVETTWDEDIDREDEAFCERILVPNRREINSNFDPNLASVQATAAPYQNKDVVEDLARALLTDCINKRNMEQNKLRKIKVDIISDQSASTSDGMPSFNYSSPNEYDSKVMPLYEDGGGVLSCSSSDDELNQLYMLQPSFVWDENCCNKNCHDPSHCHDVDNMVLTSSPDSDGFYEEKRGLPKEVRYNLPIAYGTVHETEKHCTICQVPYEIGTHIVTLTPCQHFFHALCVDKWLYNHVTCPLCRKEVVYEMDNDVSPASVHVRGTECPEEDQENVRRKIRSQCAEFRPVRPLPAIETENLESQFSSLQVMDERRQLRLDHLACPTPQRQSIRK